MVNSTKNKLAAFIVSFGLMLFLLAFFGHGKVSAYTPGSAGGRVYVIWGGQKIPLIGAKVWKTAWWKWGETYCSNAYIVRDFDWGEGARVTSPNGARCYGHNDGVETTVLSYNLWRPSDPNIAGRYLISNSHNVPPPIPGCFPAPWIPSDALQCPTGPVDGVRDDFPIVRGDGGEGSCYYYAWCGFHCEQNPHAIRAYFPSDYTWLTENYPQIPFKAGDIDGGGWWEAVGNCEGDGKSHEEWHQVNVDNDSGVSECNFEWHPPQCDLKCSASSNPSTVSHAGGGTITLNANVWGDTYDSVDWMWKPGSEHCGTLREDPNLETRAYVDFESTDVCTGEVVALAIGDCTASCPTSFEITNVAPQVISISPDAGLSGTETEDDNGPGCSDNNPQVYSVTYRDGDGCGDISKAYFWADNIHPSISTLDSSARASVQRDGSDWRIYGLRCISGCDQVGNWSWGLGGALMSQFEPTSPYLYFPNSLSTTADCTSRSGACSESVAGVRPFAATCSGNDLTVKYKVWYYDDDIGNLLNLYGYVTDYAKASHGWLSRWTWSLDFDHPLGSISTVHYEGDDPDTVRFPQNASDDGVYDSGLRSVIDRRYWLDREGVGRLPSDPEKYFSAGSNVTGLNGRSTWSDEFGPEPGLKGGDVIFAEISMVDRACNMSTEPYQSDEIGHEWIQTFGNSVYGYAGFDDPIPIAGEHLSSYWLGGDTVDSCSPSGFNGIGVGSLQSPWWCSYDYDDENRKDNNGSWYDTFYRLALRSDFVRKDQGGEIYSRGSVDFGNGTDEVIKYTGGTSLVVSDTCDGRKVIFVPNGRNVEIHPQFEVVGPGDACLLIAEDAVTIVIKPGGDAPDDEDDIDMAIVSDGSVVVEEDQVPPKYDTLLVNGMIFADDALFLRDLVWEDNTREPAETIVHDARYIYLLRDMIGSRWFTDFECGIVQGSSKCDSWPL